LPVPQFALNIAKQSIGAAFVVADRAPTPQAGGAIRTAAQDAFMSGFHAGALAAAAVAFATAIAAWIFLPARAAALRPEVPAAEHAHLVLVADDPDVRGVEREMRSERGIDAERHGREQPAHVAVRETENVAGCALGPR